jgi:hypothetical protein
MGGNSFYPGRLRGKVFALSGAFFGGKVFHSGGLSAKVPPTLLDVFYGGKVFNSNWLGFGSSVLLR